MQSDCEAAGTPETVNNLLHILHILRNTVIISATPPSCVKTMKEISIEAMLRKSDAAKESGRYLEALYFTQQAYSLCSVEVKDPWAE